MAATCHAAEASNWRHERQRPHMKLNRRNKLAAQYLIALRVHFEQGSPESLLAAHSLGSEIVSLGLETLDLAKIHDHAVAELLPPDCAKEMHDAMAMQAAPFFAEAMLPIEKTHRVALEASTELSRMNLTLAQLTAQLEDSNRELKLQISDRKTTQAALKMSERATGKLLEESRLLEQQLQIVAHKILLADEETRKKMSLQLNDEIAQPLLGIHVRLLTLKNEAEANHTSLTKDITITQRLVEQSMQTLKQFVSDFGIPHEV